MYETGTSEFLRQTLQRTQAINISVFVNQIQSYVESKGYEFKIFHLGSIFWIAFTEKEHIRTADAIDADSMKYFRQLYHHLLENGVYMGPSGYEVGFVSAAHTKADLDKTIKAFEISLKTLVK